MLQHKKKGQGTFPLSGTNTTIQGNQREGVCPVAFLRWKSVVLLKRESEGPGSPETPLPTAGSGARGVKFRPQWGVLWKSFVRNQHLVRNGTLLRLRMVKTTTSHSPFKGQALFLPWVFRLATLPPHPSPTPGHLSVAQPVQKLPAA